MTLFLVSCGLICAGLLLTGGAYWLHFERDVDPKNHWTGEVAKLGLVVALFGSMLFFPGLISALS